MASPTRPVRKPKLSVEEIKERSNYLSEGVAEHVFDDTTDHVDDATYQLLKFSGMYQQDDRDLRKQRRQEGKNKAYSFMLRSRAPAGRLSAAQYLVHDRLADEVGNGTLRLTTRQGVQLHGIIKGDIQKTIQGLHSELVTSLAACGDVNRNVMACPAPEATRRHALLEEVADELDARLLPKTEAYYQLWLDGERQPLPAAATPETVTYEPVTYKPVAKADDIEPIYGRTYLPRKFKIGLAYPEDNCVDVYTQDVGIVPVMDGETLRGFNLMIGGGLGMSHTDPDTRPFLAKHLGFVAREQLAPTVEGIVTVQRDFGNRQERKFARMKWLVETRGIPWFRAELESRLGFELMAWVPVGRFTLNDHLGWYAQGDGKFYFGLYVENGRIKDEGDLRLRTALRKLLTRYPNEIRITAQHNILLTDLSADDEAPIRELLREHGVKTKEDISQARRFAMACPALPTCGLALAESERMLPGVLDKLELELAELGLANEEISIRMTGCPNGCARPYTAELAFVGKSLDKYNVYVGGAFEGTRLVREYAEMVSGGDLVATVKPLLAYWHESRSAGERFGDFCHRVGLERLRHHAESYAEDVVAA